ERRRVRHEPRNRTRAETTSKRLAPAHRRSHLTHSTLLPDTTPLTEMRRATNVTAGGVVAGSKSHGPITSGAFPPYPPPFPLTSTIRIGTAIRPTAFPLPETSRQRFHRAASVALEGALSPGVGA